MKWSIFTQDQFLPSGIVIACVCVCMYVSVFVGLCVFVYMCQSWPCLRHNSSPVQVRITQFGPEVQNTLVKIPILLGVIDLDHPGQWKMKYTCTWASKELLWLDFNMSVFMKIIGHVGTFLLTRPKCLMRDFTNLNRIYKAHPTNVWWTMKVFWVHTDWHVKLKDGAPG